MNNFLRFLIPQTAIEISEATLTTPKTPEVPCTFQTYSRIHGESFYSCWVTDKEIPNDQEFRFVGRHETGKTDADVIELQFVSCSITKIPKGLLKIFSNLKMLSFYQSQLGSITKNDLNEFKNLRSFTCQDDKIKFLPGNLFEGLKDLEYVNFYRNELIIIEPNILDGLTKLKHVDFQQNPNYYTFYSTNPQMDTNATLKEVQSDLHRKFKSTPKMVMDLRHSKVKSGFFDDIKAFIQDENTKDLKIVIDGQEFPVHKFLLAARSSTLAELLKNNPEVENLNLVDISVEIFEKILKFVYTDELPEDDGTNFVHLFVAAGKLKIKKLNDYAATKLIDQINENNALDIFKLSNKYKNADLMQKSFEEIKKKHPTVKFKDEWETDPEKLEKAIEIIKQREEADRKMREELEKLGI